MARAWTRQVDDGKQVAVVIPEGLSPGDEFEVEEPDWSAAEQQGAVLGAKEEAVAPSSVAPVQDQNVRSSHVSDDVEEDLPLGWSAHVSNSTGET